MELATAYVQIIPSARGLSGKLDELIGGEAESAGKKAGGGFGSKLLGAAGTVIKTGATAAIGGLTVAATGVGALTKSAVEEYANLEQLVGGVETLFGNSAWAVEWNANRAFKTAGMSANEYMETSTSFAASLLQGLGGDTMAAAKMADTAIVDMSDNANKMGTDIASIQNAYQGFAKQNYTMLDNLKLGYGGTKEEMVRLINDSGILEEKIENLDNITFDQIVTAIHAVQENMGITGTTAAEASSTIQGSIASMQGAWSNLLAGMAWEESDWELLVGDFVDSAVTVAENLIPRIGTVIEGIGTLIQELVPPLLEYLPPMITEILPELITAAIELAIGVAEAVIEIAPTIVESIISAFSGISGIGEIVQLAWDVIQTVFDSIVIAIGTVTESMDGAGISWGDVWNTVAGIVQGAANLIGAAIQLIGMVIGWLVTEAQTDGTLINGIWQNIQLVFSTAAAVIQGIVDALTAVLQGDWSAAGTAISGIVSAMWSGIQTYFTNGSNIAKNIITNLGSTILSTLSGLASSAWTWGSDLLSNFIAGIRSKIASLISSVSSIASTVRSYLGFSEPELGPLSNFHTYAPDMMDLFMEGVEQKTPELVQTISGAFGQARNAIGTLPAEFTGAPASYTAQEQDSRALSVLMDILEVLRQIRNRDNGAGISMNDLIDIFDERMGATALRLERGN